MRTFIIGNPLHDALQRAGVYGEDVEWWRTRVDAWRYGKPTHATDGWTRADDLSGLRSRQQHYAEEQAKAIGLASLADGSAFIAMKEAA